MNKLEEAYSQTGVPIIYYNKCLYSSMKIVLFKAIWNKKAYYYYYVFLCRTCDLDVTFINWCDVVIKKITYQFCWNSSLDLGHGKFTTIMIYKFHIFSFKKKQTHVMLEVSSWILRSNRMFVRSPNICFGVWVLCIICMYFNKKYA